MMKLEGLFRAWGRGLRMEHNAEVMPRIRGLGDFKYLNQGGTEGADGLVIALVWALIGLSWLAVHGVPPILILLSP